MNMDVFHCRVYFKGKVQGVGFRYQCIKSAREFEVCGFVENLPDGRVLLEAEGSEMEVEKFIAEIIDQMDVFIRDVEKRNAHRPAELNGFSMK